MAVRYDAGWGMMVLLGRLSAFHGLFESGNSVPNLEASAQLALRCFFRDLWGRGWLLLCNSEFLLPMLYRRGNHEFRLLHQAKCLDLAGRERVQTDADYRQRDQREQKSGDAVAGRTLRN